MAWKLRPLIGSIVFLYCYCLTPAIGESRYSDLWGRGGQKWTPASRLPDFSFAGYRHGERPIPRVKTAVTVTQFGAKGDGRHDDTKSFVQAIAKVQRGAVYVPPGRYKITDILYIRRSGVVLRGAGADKTTLYFPKYLNDVKPNWGQTTSGRRTSNYSWSGGYIWVEGSFASRTLARVTAAAQRGEKTVTVSTVAGLTVGQYVELRQTDTRDNSLARHLYADQPGDTKNLRGRMKTSLVARITAIGANRITLDRALRCDVRPPWRPQLLRFAPTVTEVGVENMTFEFPAVRYGGHFTELGHNPLTFRGVAHCWARDLRIVNADSGPQIGARFCTIRGITFEADRQPDRRGCVGHHGLSFGGDDNLFTDFDFKVRFIHDITVAWHTGNVASNGRGVDLCFDHHRAAPYANLFTNIDIGRGARMFACGGGRALGVHSGAWETFWCIRSQRPQSWPGRGFGPDRMNLVGVQTAQPTVKTPTGKWFEAIDPTKLSPRDLHQAQLKRRLRGK